MSNADSEVVNTVNLSAEQRFKLELMKNSEIQRFKDAEAALKREHEAKLKAIQAEIDLVDAEIWQQVDRHRSSLIARGKRSFVTLAAKFQLRRSEAKTKVSDPEAIMEIARHERLVKRIADPPPKRAWKFNLKKFLAWLEHNGEYRPLFEDYLEQSGESESLTIQPNGTYTVLHDSRRISPPSVSVKKKS